MLIKIIKKQLLGLAILLLAGFSYGAGELRIYNWADYIDPQVPQDFSKKNDIKITWDVFESTEVLDAKLLTGKSGYDLVVPTNTTLERMTKLGALAKLDKSKIPNWKNLDPNLMAIFASSDPGNQHAMPYMYGMNIIGFNPDKVHAILGENAPVDSWDLIFKLENISKLKECGVAIMDSPEEIMPIILSYLGLSPNSTNIADYDTATEFMKKIRPNIAYFHSAKYMTDIANGDICVAIGYSGSFYQFGNRAKEAGNGVTVDWRLPKEGAPIWYDSFVIPKDAINLDEAHAFINYLLEPSVIAQISNFLGYPNPNLASQDKITPAIAKNTNLVPTTEQMKTLYILKPLPQNVTRARTRAWHKIKSGL